MLARLASRQEHQDKKRYRKRHNRPRTTHRDNHNQLVDALHGREARGAVEELAREEQAERGEEEGGGGRVDAVGCGWGG